MADVTAIILALLYLTLLVIVRRAERIMVTQQNTVRERTDTLKLLSAQLVTAEENEKRCLAKELRKGVAQTLSAVKFQVERTA